MTRTHQTYKQIQKERPDGERVVPSFLVPASKHRINHSPSHEWSKGKMRKVAKNIIPEQWFHKNVVFLTSSNISITWKITRHANSYTSRQTY